MYEQGNYPLLFVPCYLREVSRIWENVIYFGKKYEYKKGTLFSLGAYDNLFGYVKSGLTCCYYNDKYGNKDEIRFFIGEGCLFKETFVMANFGFYKTDHRCITDTEIYLFDRNIIFNDKFIASHIELLNNFIFSLSIKSVSIQLFVSLLRCKNTIQKVAHYIYGFYLLNNKKLCFEPPFSQVYLAELLGISKFTINRIILKFKQANILKSYTKKRIEILDVEKLKKLKNEN